MKDRNTGDGFGHRVYKNYDPRAKVMQQSAKEVLAECGDPNYPVLQVAQELERIALSDEYFIERKLYPNVDFYSASRCRRWLPDDHVSPLLFRAARTVAGSRSEGDDRGPVAEDRAAAAALHGRPSATTTPIERLAELAAGAGRRGGRRAGGGTGGGAAAARPFPRSGRSCPTRLTAPKGATYTLACLFRRSTSRRLRPRPRLCEQDRPVPAQRPRGLLPTDNGRCVLTQTGKAGPIRWPS